MPDFPSLIPQLQTQPQTPEETSLQDVLAKRAQAQLPPWKQNVISGVDNTQGFLGGMFGLPEGSGPTPNNLGFAAGAMIPGLGVATRSLKSLKNVGAAKLLEELMETTKLGKFNPNKVGGFREGEMLDNARAILDPNNYGIEHGPLNAPAQALVDHLKGIQGQLPSPEDMQAAIRNSKVVSTNRGVSPHIINAPEGFGFKTPDFHYNKTATLGETPGNQQYALWQNLLNRTRPQQDIPVYTGIGDLNDIARSSVTKDYVRPAISGGGSVGQGRMGLARSNITADQIKKIRSFNSLDEAREAFPEMNTNWQTKDRFRQIYNKLMFPGVK